MADETDEELMKRYNMGPAEFGAAKLGFEYLEKMFEVTADFLQTCQDNGFNRRDASISMLTSISQLTAAASVFTIRDAQDPEKTGEEVIENLCRHAVQAMNSMLRAIAEEAKSGSSAGPESRLFSFDPGGKKPN